MHFWDTSFGTCILGQTKYWASNRGHLHLNDLSIHQNTTQRLRRGSLPGKIPTPVKHFPNHLAEEIQCVGVTVSVHLWISWLPYSTYLHLDFHMCSMTKLKEHSREICYVSSRMYSFKYLRLKIQVQIKTQIQAAQISAVETCHSCVIGENLNNLQKSRYPTKLAAPSSLGADIWWGGRK